MPWTETDAVTQRHKFILAHQEGLFSMTELCLRFGISRKTGYKWLGRYREEGLDGLRDRSRAPAHSPHRTPEPVCELLVEARRAHPRWGPRKLLDYLRPRHPDVDLPAPSTVGDLLKREGLVEPRRRRRRPTHPGARPLAAEAPGQVWSADFKGEFRLGSGAYCYPLTVQDGYSRYLVACHGLPSTALAGTRAVFERLFHAWGLPERIRTDNGSPFACTRALAGLSSLSAWWIQLGITPERIEPGCPQQNGQHERMHRTLKAEATRPPGATPPEQQRRFDDFLWEFNEVRPHQSLDGAVPASRFAPCARAMPSRIPSPDYPGHAEVRLVSSQGSIKFKNQVVFVSGSLAGQHVALEETDDGIWEVTFYHVLLARYDERTKRLRDGTR